MINLLRALLPLLKGQKSLVATLICSAVLGQWMLQYVDAKHREGMVQLQETKFKIEQTQKQITRMQIKEVQSHHSLASIEKSVDAVAERLRTMDQRIWELYRESKRSKIEGQEFSLTKTPQEEPWVKVKSRN